MQHTLVQVDGERQLSGTYPRRLVCHSQGVDPGRVSIELAFVILRKMSVLDSINEYKMSKGFSFEELHTFILTRNLHDSSNGRETFYKINVSQQCESTSFYFILFLRDYVIKFPSCAKVNKNKEFQGKKLYIFTMLSNICMLFI